MKRRVAATTLQLPTNPAKGTYMASKEYPKTTHNTRAWFSVARLLLLLGPLWVGAANINFNLNSMISAQSTPDHYELSGTFKLQLFGDKGE